jgi:hypothetical protein
MKHPSSCKYDYGPRNEEPSLWSKLLALWRKFF